MSFKIDVLLPALYLTTLAIPSSALFAQEQGGTPVPGIKPAVVATEMSDEEMMKKASIILIYNQLGRMLAQLKADGIELDKEAALEGARRAIEQEELGVTIPEAQQIMQKLQAKAQAAQQKRREEMMAKMKADAESNKKEGEAYLVKNGKKEGVQVLDGGVQYEVMVAGDGPKPQPTDKVKINYHGTLIDGKVFDSTLDPPSGRPAQPYVNSASAFVPGFNTAIQSMPVGSKWKISIPGEQAYGLRGPGMIGPNRTIIFEVELLEIVDGEAAGNDG